MTVGAVMLVAAGCGTKTDYKNAPRPAAPITVTASVSQRGVSVSPTAFGAGPIIVVITNQTDTSQQVTFETDELAGTRPGITQTTEPINPQGTGQLKVDVAEGRYRLRTDNDVIQPARLTVGPKRESAQNKVLQP